MDSVRGTGRHPAMMLGLISGWLLVAVFVPAVVRASNFGGPKDASAECDGNLSSECVAENYTHFAWYDSSITTPYITAMNYAVSHYTSVTDMSVATQGLSNTNDVRVYRANYGSNGAWAWTACQDPPLYAGSRPLNGHTHGHNWCKPQLIHWNTYYDANYATSSKRNAIACHELGHTMGLQHTSDSASCMKNPPTVGGIAQATTTHDRGHVNAHYP